MAVADETNILTTLKILIIGESSVGKSRFVFICRSIGACGLKCMLIICSLMLRFTEDDFDSDQALTIGVDFKTKVINIDGVNVKLGN